MDSLPYIPGTKSANPGPLARFLPPLEDGTVSSWLAHHVEPGAWLLDPFGFSPRLVVEAARAGYRVLVAANNPINRFLVEMAANAPSEAELKSVLADLGASRKGEERLETHLQSLYITSCANCGREIPAQAFWWRKGEEAPYARVYKCPHCEDSGEKLTTPADVERATQMSRMAGMHRARVLERVAPMDDPDREYAEEALQVYLPRSIYALATLINRIDALNLPPERNRALTALILSACDVANSLWGHPSERPRPKQLVGSNQFREQNVWMALEMAIDTWSETSSKVPFEAWPQSIPESGGICLYEGRLRDMAIEVRKEAPIAAVIGAIPRPNQAFWTLSALWAGWLWGREAAEPFKLALRRRRYDWGWNATALGAAFRHLNTMLEMSTPFFGLLAEPEPPFLTSALVAADSAGFDLSGLTMRTQHDPLQITWKLGQGNHKSLPPDPKPVRRAISDHLAARSSPASYLHIHAAGLMGLAKEHALKGTDTELDDSIRAVHIAFETALRDDKRFIHFGSGENLDTGLWGLKEYQNDSLADRVEMVIVKYLQKHPQSIYLEIEDALYPRFPALMTPSKGLIYNVLYSYAEREGGMWKLRTEDYAAARRVELEQIAKLLETVGERLDYVSRRDDNTLFWEENGKIVRVFYLLASALIGRVIKENRYPVENCLLVIPGGRSALVAHKQQRDPALAEQMKNWRILKFRLVRALAGILVLNRQTFEEQIISDPVEQAKGQMMMF